MKNIKIIVATHKEYWMPDDEMYIPVLVGAEGKEPSELESFSGYLKDNDGENISDKNSSYCELTGLYWAWKNLDADYIGLVHYRRHFTIGAVAARKYNKNLRKYLAGHSKENLNKKMFGDSGSEGVKQDRKKRNVLTEGQLKMLLKRHDIILPKKRNYYIETNYSQYVHAHNKQDLDITRDILSEKYPEYLGVYDAYMSETKGHRFNMFIMKKNLFDEYCNWLFDILFELEKRLDISDYSDYDSRVYGFVSERLLDVWINTKKLGYVELPYYFMENQNWLVKGGRFLKRKFMSD